MPQSPAQPIPALPPILPIYALLGMLSEFIGCRMLNGRDEIETFYAHERACTTQFATYLQQVAAAEQIDAQVTEKIYPHGRIAFTSPTLAPVIDRFYSFESQDLPFRDGDVVVSVAEIRFGQINPAVFLPSHLEDDVVHVRTIRRSYLVGAYQRYGEGSSIRLANSAHKAERITALLKAVGCTFVSWAYEASTIPNTHTITFRPTRELAALCGLPAPPDDI